MRVFKTALKRRRRGSIIRLKVNAGMPEAAVDAEWLADGRLAAKRAAGRARRWTKGRRGPARGINAGGRLRADAAAFRSNHSPNRMLFSPEMSVRNSTLQNGVAYTNR